MWRNIYVVLSSGRDKTTLRVLAIHFKEALGQIEKPGKVTDKNISGEDVTEEYRDLEIRLDSAEKTRKRYLELLYKKTRTRGSTSNSSDARMPMTLFTLSCGIGCFLHPDIFIRDKLNATLR
jgi:hypothetical protein